jgi:hypothetical protein
VTTVRKTPPGATRTCPHCRAVILQSAAVCPSCRKHLRFVPGESVVAPTFVPLRVEGTIHHPAHGEAWEYAVVVAVSNERGEVVTRQIVGVGAIGPSDVRRFTLEVEVFAPEGTKVPVMAD